MQVSCSVNSLDVWESLDLGLYQEDSKQMQQNGRNALCNMCTDDKLSSYCWLGWRRDAAGDGQHWDCAPGHCSPGQPVLLLQQVSK